MADVRIGWRIWRHTSGRCGNGMIPPAKNPQRSWKKGIFTMIFEEKDKRTGKKYIVCSKYWPDGDRFRRRFSNKTLAKNVLDRITGAIATGTWRDLKKEMT